MTSDVALPAPARHEVVVADIMTRNIHTCSARDMLDRPARLMWEYDCGAIPVLDHRGQPVGMVTDCDVCMAAYTQGKPLNRISVGSACSAHAHCIRADTTIGEAHHLMKTHRVRRLPVVDSGGNLVGFLSLADVVRHATTLRAPTDPLQVASVAATLVEIFRPHDPHRRSP